jgi:hypothetical protein
MNKPADRVLKAFENFSGDDKQGVAPKILRRTVDDESHITDEELVRAADQVFLELDRREE